MKTRGPKAIGDVLSELMARRGYARVQSAAAYDAAWREAAGPLAAKYTRPACCAAARWRWSSPTRRWCKSWGFRSGCCWNRWHGSCPTKGSKIFGSAWETWNRGEGFWQEGDRGMMIVQAS